MVHSCSNRCLRNQFLFLCLAVSASIQAARTAIFFQSFETIQSSCNHTLTTNIAQQPTLVSAYAKTDQCIQFTFAHQWLHQYYPELLRTQLYNYTVNINKCAWMVPVTPVFTIKPDQNYSLDDCGFRVAVLTKYAVMKLSENVTANHLGTTLQHFPVHIFLPISSLLANTIISTKRRNVVPVSCTHIENLIILEQYMVYQFLLLMTHVLRTLPHHVFHNWGNLLQYPKQYCLPSSHVYQNTACVLNMRSHVLDQRTVLQSMS